MSHAHHPDHVDSNETPLDSWHRHTPDEGMPREEHGSHANVALLLIIFAVLFVATVGCSVAIGVYTMHEFSLAKRDAERVGYEASIGLVTEYEEDSKASQSGYGWTEDGRVRMPIERAMDLVVEERGG